MSFKRIVPLGGSNTRELNARFDFTKAITHKVIIS